MLSKMARQLTKRDRKIEEISEGLKEDRVYKVPSYVKNLLKIMGGSNV